MSEGVSIIGEKSKTTEKVKISVVARRWREGGKNKQHRFLEQLNTLHGAVMVNICHHKFVQSHRI